MGAIACSCGSIGIKFRAVVPIWVSLAVVCLSGVSYADTHVWKSGATGGWSDPGSYEEGVIPEAGDTVRIPDEVTAEAEDDDIALISSLKAVLIEGYDSKIVFDVSEDHEIACTISGTKDGKVATESGTIEKNGSGTLWLRANSSLWNYYADIVVNEGILRLQEVSHDGRNQYYRSLTVNKPGILYTTVNGEGDVVHFRSMLFGDGLITNPSSTKVIFYVQGLSASAIPEFSGTLGGLIAIAAPEPKCYQDFTGTGSTNPSEINLGYKLSLGLASLGGKDGDEPQYGSFGCGYIYFKGAGTLRYLGTGESSYARFRDGADMQFAHIDAGVHGGLRLMGTFGFDQTDNMLKRLILSGENAQECTIEGTMFNRHSGAVYLTKKGSGTWALASETAFSNGVIAVENGTLRFTSIRNKGMRCSLGGATILRSDHTGAVEDAEPLPYAYLLGTADTTGTMRYSGSAQAVCDDRAFAIKGSGRVTSSGGRLVLSGGVGSVIPGENVLYLGGTASGSVMNNITNGTGVLKVVKEDPGDWSLGGNLGFTGGIEVKEGCLTLGHGYVPGSYTRYRLTLRAKNEGGSGDPFFTLGRFALFNADGEVIEMNPVHNPAMNSNKQRTGIEREQLAYHTEGNFSPNNIYNTRVVAGKDEDGKNIYAYPDEPIYNVTNVFSGLNADPQAYGRFRHKGCEGTSFWPNLTAEDYWPSIDFRLPAGAEPAVRYDIGTRHGSAAKNSETKTAAKKNWMNSIGSWTLYGSVDGETWTELSSVTSNDLRGVDTTDCSWLSDGTSYATADGWTNRTSGWEIASRPEGSAVPVYTRFSEVQGTVSVAEGAELRANGDYTIGSLALGTSNGVIDGFTFAENGTLEVSGYSGENSVRLGVTFSGTEGLANLKKWTVSSDSGILHVVSADENGVTVGKYGMRLIIR